jgi:hypothetical protein
MRHKARARNSTTTKDTRREKGMQTRKQIYGRLMSNLPQRCLRNGLHRQPGILRKCGGKDWGPTQACSRAWHRWTGLQDGAGSGGQRQRRVETCGEAHEGGTKMEQVGRKITQTAPVA